MSLARALPSPAPAPRPALRLIRADESRASCALCNQRNACFPGGLEPALLNDLVYTRKRVKRGEALYREGSGFEFLYAVRSGFFKSCVVLEDGRDQVTGFHMAGEVLGTDGIGTETHAADVVALEDSEVCVIPYARIEDFALQRQLQKVMSRELVRDHGLMMLLGTMRAEERLATFLLDLSGRFMERGYAADEFHLRMTREELGSFLGLSLETVSRLFSRFADEGLIKVQQKHIRILDVAGLRSATSHELN